MTRMSIENKITCEHGEKIKFVAGAKLWLASKERVTFFGPGIAQFLTLIDKHRIIKTARLEMNNLSYNKAHKLITIMENTLNCTIVVAQQGGQKNSRAYLSGTGRNCWQDTCGLNRSARTLSIVCSTNILAILMSIWKPKMHRRTNHRKSTVDALWRKYKNLPAVSVDFFVRT